MPRFFIALLVFFIPCYAKASVRLQYLPAVPVQYTSKLILDIQESLPVLNLTTKGNQTLKFNLEVKKEEDRLPLMQLPVTLILTVKDLFIFLNVNGEELTFDPRGEKISIPLIQLSQLIDKPLLLTIDSRGNVIKDARTFSKLFQQLPALKELSIQDFFNEMLFHLFSLCGQELTMGEKIQRQTSFVSSSPLPASIFYEISEINDQEIVARMKGAIEPRKIVFDNPIAVNNEKPKKVEMKLSGDLQGTMSWKRSNAMLYSLNSHYRYLAELKLGGMRWTMQITISHITSSVPQ